MVKKDKYDLIKMTELVMDKYFKDNITDPNTQYHIKNSTSFSTFVLNFDERYTKKTMIFKTIDSMSKFKKHNKKVRDVDKHIKSTKVKIKTTEERAKDIVTKLISDNSLIDEAYYLFIILHE